MKVCRVCGIDDEKKSPMSKLFDDRKKQLVKQIEALTGITLSFQMGLPKHICDNCIQDLKRATKFRERCIEAQKQFHLHWVKSKEKATKNIGNENVVHFTVERYCELETDVNEEEEEEAVNDNLEFIIEHDGDGNTETELWNSDSTTDKDDHDNSLAINTKNTSEISKVCVTKNRCKKVYGPFVCELCGKSFNYIGNFREHQLRHTGNKQFTCTYCSFKFYTNKELVRHVRRHTGERPYACEYCGSRFTDLSTKTKHERRHTDDRRFKCDHCAKTFVSSGCLKKHILTHTGVRSHCCTVCNIWFLRRTHLVAHFRSRVHKQRETNHQISQTADIESEESI